jgi:hypothetical protein
MDVGLVKKVRVHSDCSCQANVRVYCLLTLAITSCLTHNSSLTNKPSLTNNPSLLLNPVLLITPV